MTVCQMFIFVQKFGILPENKSFNLLNGRTWEIRCKDLPLAPRPRPIGPKLSLNTIKDRLTFLAFLQLLIWWISQYQKNKNDDNNHVVIWAKTFLFICIFIRLLRLQQQLGKGGWDKTRRGVRPRFSLLYYKNTLLRCIINSVTFRW